MSRSRPILAGLLLVAVTVVTTTVTAGAASSPAPPPSAAVAEADANEASLVANEDSRIVDIRSLGALARAQHSTLINAPYRLRTGSFYTLVLTARSTPYTVNDLLQLAPQTFVQEPDGAYLLSEDIYVEQGAILQLLATASPLRIRLLSDSTGFVSIVSFGGTLNFQGTASAPVSIASYDPSTGGVDRVVADGRAYVRSIGGSVNLNYVDTSDLGFWSGRTGGFAITGNDRPQTGVLGAASTATQTYGANHHPGHDAAKAGAAAAAAKAATATPAGDGAIQPAGRLNPSQQSSATGTAFQYAGGSVTNSAFDDNAFGLFLSGAKNFLVTDSSFTDNLYSGLVVHRYVTGASLQRDISAHNGVDGFDVTRAANNVQMLQDTADHNGAIGFSLNGNPLATTESAAGTPLTAYGNHMIANSTASANGTIGIEVNGALNTIVESSVVTGSPMGIVVRGTARNTSILANRIDHAAKHGISILDGVSGAAVDGNTIDNSGTGIYVRNSVAAVSHNSIDGGDKHAISLVGQVGTTSVTYNAMKGTGDGAIDTYRAHGSRITVANNDTAGWVDLRVWTRHLKQLVRPLTLLWLAVILLIAVTAIRGRRRFPAGTLPYANSRSLSPTAANPRAVPTRVTPRPASTGSPLWLPGSAEWRSSPLVATANNNGGGV